MVQRGDSMKSFCQDLRFAFRALGKSPWFAALAVVTLALGIAVNTSIFSTINGFLLRPMPVPHPEQLAVLSLQQVGERTFQKFSYADYVDLRDQSAAFSDIIACRITLSGLAADNRGDHCIVTRVSGNYFSVLGVQPALSRTGIALARSAGCRFRGPGLLHSHGGDEHLRLG